MIAIKEVLIYCTELISRMLPFALLILCGIYLSVKGKFFQLRLLRDSAKLMKKAFIESKKSNGITSFQAACTSLSAAVGTGNIAGVAGAISIGGAGAVFWMWISALFGMAIKACEIVIGVNYRINKENSFIGGPMYYIKKGLPTVFSPLAIFFAIFGLPAVFCTGNITQTNAAVVSVTEDKALRLILGVFFTALTYAAISGGLKRIGLIAERIVPVMSVLYILICSVLIILNIDFLPQAFKMIIVGAFNPKAITGGAVGSFITVAVIGAERGIFSNEAGLGTASIAHSAAKDANPDYQGLFGIFEVFVDTILICTLTALTILCSRIDISYGKAASSELVVKALDGIFGKTSSILISVMLCLFAFSSIIGWAAYGGIFAEFLLGERFKKAFMLIYPLGCITGAISDVETAWKLSAFFSGIMLCLNLPSLILLSDTALKYFKKEEKKNVSKKNPRAYENFKGKPSRNYNQRC